MRGRGRGKERFDRHDKGEKAVGEIGDFMHGDGHKGNIQALMIEVIIATFLKCEIKKLDLIKSH